MGALRRAVSVLVVGGGPYGSTPVFVGGGQAPGSVVPAHRGPGPVPGVGGRFLGPPVDHDAVVWVGQLDFTQNPGKVNG